MPLNLDSIEVELLIINYQLSINLIMAQRTKSPALTVSLLREGIIESVHQVQAVVCDSRGRVLSVAGRCRTSDFHSLCAQTFSSDRRHEQWDLGTIPAYRSRSSHHVQLSRCRNHPHAASFQYSLAG